MKPHEPVGSVQAHSQALLIYIVELNGQDVPLSTSGTLACTTASSAPTKLLGPRCLLSLCLGSSPSQRALTLGAPLWIVLQLSFSMTAPTILCVLSTTSTAVLILVLQDLTPLVSRLTYVFRAKIGRFEGLLASRLFRYVWWCSYHYRYHGTQYDYLVNICDNVCLHPRAPEHT